MLNREAKNLARGLLQDQAIAAGEAPCRGERDGLVWAGNELETKPALWPGIAYTVERINYEIVAYSQALIIRHEAGLFYRSGVE